MHFEQSRFPVESGLPAGTRCHEVARPGRAGGQRSWAVAWLRFSSEGLSLAGYLAAPAGPRPSDHGVVLCHGYPNKGRGAENSGKSFPQLADRLSESLGWPVLTINFRGCAKSEGDFSLDGWQHDIAAAIDEVAALGIAHVWLVGFGTGGFPRLLRRLLFTMHVPAGRRRVVFGGPCCIKQKTNKLTIRYTSSRKKIQVSVPAGIDNGQSIRIREKGEPGTNGGPRGDLLVEVNVARHPIFQRQDMNIFSTAPLTYAQAALGGTVRIHTVDGTVENEIKTGTKSQAMVSTPDIRSQHNLILQAKVFG